MQHLLYLEQKESNETESNDVTKILGTLVVQQGQVLSMLATLIKQTNTSTTSTTGLQPVENLPTSFGLQTPSSGHQLPVTDIPTLTVY